MPRFRHPDFRQPGRKCGVPGCGRDHYALGRCQAHYMRFRRTGYDNRVMTGRPGVWRWIDHIQDTPGPFNSGGGS